MASIDIDRIASVVVPGTSDSRRCMKEQLIKILGLDADATEEQILEALKARTGTAGIAKALDLSEDASEQDILDAIKASKDEPETSLEDRAKAEGKVVVSEDALRTLTEKADAGAAAADKLHQREFDDAFDRALNDPEGARVDSKDETRERYQKLYDKAPDETLEILDGLPRLVNAKPKGHGGGPSETPEGVDEERAELDKRIKARMEDKGEDYATALDAVLAEDKESER